MHVQCTVSLFVLYKTTLVLNTLMFVSVSFTDIQVTITIALIVIHGHKTLCFYWPIIDVEYGRHENVNIYQLRGKLRYRIYHTCWLYVIVTGNVYFFCIFCLSSNLRLLHPSSKLKQFYSIKVVAECAIFLLSWKAKVFLICSQF